MQADVITFGACIACCAEDGHWQMAVQLLTEMPAARVAANAISFNSCISACETGALVEGTLNVEVLKSTYHKRATPNPKP